MPVLHLHGSPLARLDGGGGEVVLSAREAALLAWLHLEGATSRARLAGLLWPNGSEAQARANLRQTLARLRRAAGPLVHDDAGGTLALAATVSVAVPDPSGAPLLGPLTLDDAPAYADWLQAQREAAVRERQRLRLADGQAALAAGDLDRALTLADELLAMHPESEEAWRLRMEAFERRGDRASALQAWDECRLALRAAFGVAPSAPTQALGARLLAGTARPSPPVPGQMPTVLRQPPRMVGRDDALRAVLRSLALGHGAAVTGPGGIGKSRLLAEVAAREGEALVVGARPGDDVAPGALLARLVREATRRWRPEVDEATRAEVAQLCGGAPGASAASGLRSPADRRRALDSLAHLLGACQALGLRLLVVDDLQYADASSLEGLQVLLGHWHALPADQAPRLLFGARPGEGAPEAAALLELLTASGRGARIDLAALGQDDLRTLLADLALPGLAVPAGVALADALQAAVGGNPAFVLESLKSLWLDGVADWSPGQPLPVPPTLAESVRLRLQRLTPPALQMAQLAAVAGTDFSLPLAAAATGRPPLALTPLLAELDRAQVFDGRAFAHDLVAAEVGRSLPRAVAAALHQLVADHLVHHGGGAAAIARHLVLAGQGRAAAPWQVEAGRQARAQWLNVDAAAAFEAAAQAFDPAADRDRAFAAWRDAARCWNAASRPEDADRALGAAERLARLPRERLLVRATRHTWQLNGQHYADAAATALALATELPAMAATLDDDELVEAMTSAALSAPYCADPAPLLALCARHSPRVQSAPRLAARADFAEAVVLNWLARPGEALPRLRHGWALAEAHDLRSEAVNLGNQLIRSLELCGELDAALGVCAQTLDAALRAGVGQGYMADLRRTEGLLHAALGDAARARACFDDARQRLAGAPPTGYGVLSEAIAWLAAGDPARAQDLLTTADAAVPAALPLAGYTAWTRARLATARGEPAAPWLAAAAGVVGPPDGLMALRQRVMVARWSDAVDVDASPLQVLLNRLRERGLRGLARSTACAAARVALRQRRHAEALSLAREALRGTRAIDPWVDTLAGVVADSADVLRALEQAGDG
jgi:DNA-binding SARP family transcriptional activator